MLDGRNLLWAAGTAAPLRTTTSVHHHPRQQTVYDVVLVVEVEHGDGGHLARGTAGPGCP